MTTEASTPARPGEMKFYWRWKEPAAALRGEEDWRPGCRFMTEFVMRIPNRGKAWDTFWRMTFDVEANRLIMRCGWETEAGASSAIEALHKYFPDVECDVMEGACPYAGETD